MKERLDKNNESTYLRYKKKKNQHKDKLRLNPERKIIADDSVSV